MINIIQAHGVVCSLHGELYFIVSTASMMLLALSYRVRSTVDSQHPISDRSDYDELLADCGFFLHESDSFGSSEPKETNACNK